MLYRMGPVVNGKHVRELVRAPRAQHYARSTTHEEKSLVCQQSCLIVIRVARDFTAACRGDNITVVPGELQQLLANPFANTQFLTREHIRVSLQDGVRHVEARRLANRT